MPPTVHPIPVPSTRGEDAKEYLEAHGLVAIEPCIRSSDYEMVLGCPFRYYLRRRLGLVPRLHWSAALVRGSWFHRRVELYQKTPADAEEAMEEMLAVRQDELRGICAVAGIGPIERDRLLERERRDMLSAIGWYNAHLHYEVPGYGNVARLVGRSQILATELQLVLYPRRTLSPLPLVAILDMLLYQESQNVLWIVDFKTCSESTIVRLATCPIEFQTQHYLQIVQGLMEDGTLLKTFDLPPDVRLGGMIHVAVQKPTISFGQMDRPFEEYEHELKSGPRKGEIEVRRRYLGEPSFDLYIERCKRWYYAEGEYAHKKQEREDDPPVNISKTPWSTALDQEAGKMYRARVKMIAEHATRDPCPGNFDTMSASSLRAFGKLSPLAPFYLCPVHQWPDIMAQEGFMVSHRDDDIPRSRPEAGRDLGEASNVQPIQAVHPRDH